MIPTIILPLLTSEATTEAEKFGDNTQRENSNNRP